MSRILLVAGVALSVTGVLIATFIWVFPSEQAAPLTKERAAADFFSTDGEYPTRGGQQMKPRWTE